MPFCRRTSSLFRNEWLCADHWRLVPKAMRSVHHRLKGLINRSWDAATPAQQRGLADREERVWRRLQREAIVRAAQAAG